MYVYFRSSFLDQEWFTFETSGTLVVGWSGGPARQHTRQQSRAAQGLSSHRADNNKVLGIEIAAAAATGKLIL